MSLPSAAGLTETPIDATVRVMTPERIVFDYPLGGPFRRFTAYIVDLCLLALLVVGAATVSMMLSLGAASWLGPALVAYFLLSWGYGAFCESVFNGQTPGKRALGLRVVSERRGADHRRPGGPAQPGGDRGWIGAVFLHARALEHAALPEIPAPGGSGRGNHGHHRAASASTRFAPNSGTAGAGHRRPLPLRIAAGSNLARALSDYVRRRHRFGRDLREEMAEPLAAPLRARFGLPPAEPADIVLCAVYHRVFLGE